MSKIVNLTQQKLNRSRRELNETCAKLARTRADLDSEILMSRMKRARRKLRRKAREAKEANPRPRLTVVPPK
jgi:hypothetical protein